ncbi:hypothetical protein CSUI_002281, partial [Cystoisospora suis]
NLVLFHQSLALESVCCTSTLGTANSDEEVQYIIPARYTNV